MVMFLHPMGFSDARRFSTHYFNNLIGNPLDTTTAVGHLIFDGVLDKMPGLKICLPHAGGYLGAYPGRFDPAYCARPDSRLHAKELPSSYLKKMFFDIITFDPQQLEALVAKWGPEHVLLGTDYPFDMGEDDPLGMIDQLKISEQAKNRIRGANAMELLGLKVEMMKAKKAWRQECLPLRRRTASAREHGGLHSPRRSSGDTPHDDRAPYRPTAPLARQGQR